MPRPQHILGHHGAPARLGIPFREEGWHGIPLREKVWYGIPFEAFRKKTLFLPAFRSPLVRRVLHVQRRHEIRSHYNA